MTRDDLSEIAPGSLADLMDSGGGERELWLSDELAAILQHQLAADLRFDFAGFDEALGRDVEGLVQSASPPAIRSFRDLFEHPSPPVELLELTRQFAKACRARGDCPIPSEIATVLYLASIAAALVRHGCRITLLEDEALRHALQWSLDQKWMDRPTLRLLQQAHQALTSAIL